MSRVRSKTVDSTEVKKKGLPRRLNEKIALMKEKEQAQSEAFEQAMKSILEMQQASRIHTGGGSMPSLQAIDTDTPYPPNAYTVSTDGMLCLATPTYTNRDRPHSGGPIARGPGIERTQSCDAHPQNGSPHHQFWNTPNEWMESDLSRHKSDSDLQQSLLADGQVIYHAGANAPPTSVFSPSSLIPPSSPLLQVSPPFDNSLDRHPNIVSSSSDIKTNNGPLSPSRLGSSASAALLSPDYPSVANISGNDVNSVGGASSLPDLTNVEFSCGLDIPLERDEDPATAMFVRPPGNGAFYIPSSSTSSNILSFSSQPLPASIQAPPNVSLFNIVPGNMPRPLLPPFTVPRGQQGVVPPEFRNNQQHSAPPVRKFKSIVPAGSVPPPGHYGYGAVPTINPATPGNQFPYKMPPNVALQSPPPHEYPPPVNGVTPPSLSLPAPPTSLYSLPYVTPPSMPMDASLLSPPQSHFFAKPLTNFGGGMPHPSSLPPYLDPGMAYQKQMLQQKMAGMNFSSPPLRSHSEENLITSSSQKDLGKVEDVHAQNPFMGSMSSANSVPCVYVESTNLDPCVDQPDSPTTGTASPSTSASHASSPPLPRSSWLEHHAHSMSDYVFHEWPLEAVGGADRTKYGSPLSHHKSLSELNKVASDYIMDLSPSSQARAHQLSLPSIMMNDLMTVDDAMEKHLDSGAYLPSDLDMEEEVMETLLREDGFSFSVMNDAPQQPNVLNHRLDF